MRIEMKRLTDEKEEEGNGQQNSFEFSSVDITQSNGESNKRIERRQEILFYFPFN